MNVLFILALQEFNITNDVPLWTELRITDFHKWNTEVLLIRLHHHHNDIIYSVIPEVFFILLFLFKIQLAVNFPAEDILLVTASPVIKAVTNFKQVRNWRTVKCIQDVQLYLFTEFVVLADLKATSLKICVLNVY